MTFMIRTLANLGKIMNWNFLMQLADYNSCDSMAYLVNCDIYFECTHIGNLPSFFHGIIYDAVKFVWLWELFCIIIWANKLAERNQYKCCSW